MSELNIKSKLRLLIIEDSEDDALLVLIHIKKGGYIFEYERVDSAEKLKVALNEKEWDIVLSDYVMPSFSGLEALAILKKYNLDIPFILISGTIGEDVAVEAMKAGAHDYIMKDNLQRLLPAIERELRESENRKERKKAEEALRLSQEKYFQIVETANEGIWAVDVHLRTVFVNKQLGTMLGYEPAEMLGQDISCFIFEEDWPDHNLKMENRRQGISEHYERRWINKNQQAVWTIVSATPLFNEKNHFKGSFAMVTDITDRKKAEFEISRVNRALKMLSETNSSLIRMSDEQELLNQVCRIIVEVGGYRLAWIGFAEHDEAKTLRPVAHAGTGSDYIESAKVSWADNERGRGPGGTAIRTGQPFLIRNLQTDPSFAPWRESALLHGYKSIIALPMVSNEQTYGAIGIYSSETDAFDDREVNILLELANDLAFGISAMRTLVKYQKAQQDIIVSERRFKELANLLPQSIFEADENGTITFANETALSTFGYTANDVLSGLSLLNMVLQNDKTSVFESIHQILNENQPVRGEYEMVKKDGTTFPALTFTSPIMCDGIAVGLRGSITDITELKQSQEELYKKTVRIEQQNTEYALLNQKYVSKNEELIAINEKLLAALDKAEESDRLKSAFLQNLSHEIRTPMNSIMGFASLLADVDDKNLINSYSGIIVKNSEQLVRIIDDIVLYSRLQSKQLAFSPRQFDVNLLLSSIKESFNITEYQNCIEVEIESFSKEPILIYSDYDKIWQIYANLMSNSFKYTINGKITFGIKNNGNENLFFVQDTGIGIPPDEIDRIFERFYRTRNVTKLAIRGAGLGLCIVKELLEILDGKIWVESELDKGSTFYFTVPQNNNTTK